MSKLLVNDMAGEFGISVDEVIKPPSTDGCSGSQPYDTALGRPGRPHTSAVGARETGSSNRACGRAFASEENNFRRCRRCRGRADGARERSVGQGIACAAPKKG